MCAGVLISKIKIETHINYFFYRCLMLHVTVFKMKKRMLKNFFFVAYHINVWYIPISDIQEFPVHIQIKLRRTSISWGAKVWTDRFP